MQRRLAAILGADVAGYSRLMGDDEVGTARTLTEYRGVIAALVATLPGRMEAAALDRAARKQPGSMAAYECVLEAKVPHHRSKRDDNDRAQRLISRAIESELTLALQLDENDSDVQRVLAAMRLNPFHPPRFWSHLGRAYFAARRYARAGAALQARKRPRAPPRQHREGRAAALAQCRASYCGFTRSCLLSSLLSALI